MYFNKDLCVKIIKFIISVLTAALSIFFGVTALTGCGITKAYIRNAHEGSATTITITSNPSSSVSVDGNTAEVLNKK